MELARNEASPAIPRRDPESPSTKIRATGVERRFRRGRARLPLPGRRGGRSPAESETHALGPIDLDIAAGEFCCLVGPSGCGKSTFLRLVAGLMLPSAGRLEISAAAQDPAAMIFQDYGIYPWKTVLANVRFGLDVQGVPRREATARARDWLARMGLTDFADSYPAALSGGMRQRVSIARALAVEPEILLMDEPFAALDAQLRTILQEELLAICDADRRTVLFVTHSLEEAIVLGDRVLVMSARPGRILAERVPPFGRPRSGDVRNSPECAELKSELWHLLRGEVEPAGGSAA